MKKYALKIAGGIAGAALMGATLVPSVFAADLEIKDNGAGSLNTIVVLEADANIVSQQNATLVGAVVVSEAGTGENTASGNTGGDVKIITGDATSTAKVTVTGGDNKYVDPGCGCVDPAPSASIDGNGWFSKNTIVTADLNFSLTSQNSLTGVLAFVGSDAETGENKANFNTKGTTTIKTGKATSTAKLKVKGGSNVIK